MRTFQNSSDGLKRSEITQATNDNQQLDRNIQVIVKKKRKTHRRKVTMIIYTLCISKKNLKDELETTHYQKTMRTLETDPKAIKKEIEKALKRDEKQVFHRIVEQKQQVSSKQQPEHIYPFLNLVQQNAFQAPQMFYYPIIPFYNQY